MTLLITKYAVTAFVIVLVSELAKRSDRLGALISSLPFVTIMVMVWLHLEKQGTEKLASHAFYTFWYVIPTIPMFLLLPWLLHKGTGFWWQQLIRQNLIVLSNPCLGKLCQFPQACKKS